MSPQEDVLKLMFARADGIFNTWALALFAFIYFFLVTVTAGLPIAGGLFVPMMLIGNEKK
jgi:H+/Cl- antiporter ClcA